MVSYIHVEYSKCGNIHCVRVFSEHKNPWKPTRLSLFPQVKEKSSIGCTCNKKGFQGTKYETDNHFNINPYLRGGHEVQYGGRNGGERYTQGCSWLRWTWTGLVDPH